MRRTKRKGGAAFNRNTPKKTKKSIGKNESIGRFITAVKPNEPEKMKEGYYTIIRFSIPGYPESYVAKGIYLGIWENRIHLGTYVLEPIPPWTQSNPYQIPLSNVKSILQMPTEGPLAQIPSFLNPNHGLSIEETKRAKNENYKRRRKNAEKYGLYQNNWNMIP
jgi:hypothetical protein